MKNMIYTTVRKPSFMVKVALITVLFIAALIEQVSIPVFMQIHLERRSI